MVGNEYFAAIGTHVLRDRDLSDADILEGRSVAVITDDMAKRYFSGGKDPIGHHIAINIFNEPLPQMLKASTFHKLIRNRRHSGHGTEPGSQ
jgi:hypothetical protein